MGFLNQGHAHLLIRLAIPLLVVIVVFPLLAWLACSMLAGRKIPGDHLAVQATTDDHVLVLWVEGEGRDFDRGQQVVRQLNHLAVRKVQHQNVSIKRLAHFFNTLIELYIFDKTESYFVLVMR